MKILLFFLIISGIPNYLLGQQDIHSVYQDYLGAKRNDPTYWTTIRGSAYEDPEFFEASVFFRNNPRPETGELRYNALFDEMEIREENSENFLIVDRKEAIDSIRMGEKLFRFMVYEDGNDVTRGYLIQLSSGKCNLFLKKNREFQPEKKPTGGYQDYVPPSILVKPDRYYIQFGEQLPVLLPQSSRRIINLFDENGYDLSDFRKNHNIRYNMESLVPLVNYCNSQ